uniref:DUF4371 domain-containing protein n=1 Tax=Lepisosteus oculatus TaxID=7918 RepID=W5MJY2_LEPOC
KRGNMECHHFIMHPKFKKTYPPKSSIRSKKVEEMKALLKAQQLFFTKPREKGKANTEASFHVSYLLAKNQKTFTDGDLFKEAMMVAADSLFRDFKNKDEIRTPISNMSLGAETVARRVESLSEDISQQVLRDLSLFEFFSLQFDESMNMTDTTQLVLFVRMGFMDATIKEDFLTLLPLKERTRGEDIYCAFKTYTLEKNIPLKNSVSTWTDWQRSLIG